MGIFKDKSAGKAEIVGREVHTNPSPDVSLARKKARRSRIKKVLENSPISPEKRAYLEKAFRRLELEIQIAEGDY